MVLWTMVHIVYWINNKQMQYNWVKYNDIHEPLSICICNIKHQCCCVSICEILRYKWCLNCSFNYYDCLSATWAGESHLQIFGDSTGLFLDFGGPFLWSPTLMPFPPFYFAHKKAPENFEKNGKLIWGEGQIIIFISRTTAVMVGYMSSQY